MKLPIAFLVMMGAVKADGIRPPPSANADAIADDSPVLSSRPTSTGATTADDEDEAHLKTRQTEGYADLVASTTTTPGLIGSGGIGECFSRRRLLPSGRTGRQVAPGPNLAQFSCFARRHVKKERPAFGPPMTTATGSTDE